MNIQKHSTRKHRAFPAMVIALSVSILPCINCLAGVDTAPTAAKSDTASATTPDSGTASTGATASGSESPKPKLTGAELYSMHCNRCHPDRYPTERTSAQWKTIMLHMQIRANLPVSQSKLILKYLQENSGR